MVGVRIKLFDGFGVEDGVVGREDFLFLNFAGGLLSKAEVVSEDFRPLVFVPILEELIPFEGDRNGLSLILLFETTVAHLF